MIGGNLFGFVGMLTAIPVTAVLKVIMSSLIDMYRESYLYTDDAVSRLPVDGSE
jgi:predicted PurR-regulated permease PerM